MGFVFQQPALIMGLSLLDNVLVALGVQGGRVSRASRSRAVELLRELGLEGSDRMDPRQLSGGQKQRGSLARALVKDPPVVLCDEPTSALDAKSGTVVLEMLKKTAVRENRSVVVVSHDARVFPYADRLVNIENGEIISDTRSFDLSSGQRPLQGERTT
jgi:putative ABC transport system ATP-binding protein